MASGFSAALNLYFNTMPSNNGAWYHLEDVYIDLLESIASGISSPMQ